MATVDLNSVIAERLSRRLSRADETREERIARTGDIETFLTTYLPEYFDVPFGAHQKRLFKVIRDEWGDLKLVVVWPRDHGKTTCLINGLVIYAMVKFGVRFTVIITNEDTYARDLLRAIKTELEENELLIEDYGPFLDTEAPKWRTKHVWQQRQIETIQGQVIRAIGKKGKIRGRKHKKWRPGLMIFEDLQERDECKTDEIRDEDHKRVLASWLPALSQGGNIIGVGNIVHFDCVTARLAKPGSGWRVLKERAILREPKRQDLWEEFLAICRDGDEKQVRRARTYYEQRQKVMDAGGRVLWPQGRPYRWLMERKAVVGPVIFETEYQNNAYDPETQPWRREQLQTFNLRELRDARFRFVIVADPAKEKGRGRNKQAWALIGQDPKNGDIYVPAAWKGKRPDTGIVDEWFDAYLTWNAWSQTGVIRFYVEETGSMLLGPMLNDRSLKDGVNLPLKAFSPHDNKINRDSAALDPLITYRRLWIEESLGWLMDDVANFPHGDLDGIDCLAHGIGFLRTPPTLEAYGSGRKRLVRTGARMKW